MGLVPVRNGAGLSRKPVSFGAGEGAVGVGLTSPHGWVMVAPSPKLQPKARLGRTMKAAHGRARTLGGQDDIVKAGEIVAAEYPDGATLSATARKTLVLLLHAAAGDAGEDCEHSIAKVNLRGSH